MRTFLFGAVALLALGLAATPAHADTFEVFPGDSIQDAIDAAGDGDSVKIFEGTYNEAIVIDGKDIVLEADGEAENTIIDGTGFDTATLSIIGGVSNSCEIKKLTFIGGSTGASVPDYPYSNPFAGGGIFVRDSDPKIIECVIRNNEAFNGGGIALVDSEAFVEKCVIRENEAQYAGGILIYSIIADFAGTKSDLQPFFKECWIEANIATIDGSGLICQQVDALFEDCVFGQNSSANLSTIQVYECGPFFKGCTIADNVSAGIGSGGFVSVGGRIAATTALEDCIISGNTPEQGQCLDFVWPDALGYEEATTTAKDCIIENGAGEVGPGPNGEQFRLPTYDNVVFENALLSPAYVPLDGSPAIDGTDDSILISLERDVFGFPRLSGPFVDIGAIEFPSDLRGSLDPFENLGTVRSVLGRFAPSTLSARDRRRLDRALTNFDAALDPTGWSEDGACLTLENGRAVTRAAVIAARELERIEDAYPLATLALETLQGAIQTGVQCLFDDPAVKGQLSQRRQARIQWILDRAQTRFDAGQTRRGLGELRWATTLLTRWAD